jgi:DNA-binding NarL/FixJ family response regulator
MPVRVLIADDHPLIRSGPRRLLERDGEFEGVGEGGKGLRSDRTASGLKPDIAMLDVSMPRLNGIDAPQHITQRIPRTRARDRAR